MTSDADATAGSSPDGERGRDDATRSSDVEDAAPGPDAATTTDDAVDAGPDAGADGFGGRGWLLVAAVVVSTLVVPAVVYLLPSLLPSLGLPYVAALLVLPMLPAVLLGLVAVWSMAASGRR